LNTILEVSGGSSGGGGAKKESGVMGTLTDLKNICPHDYNMILINDRITEKTPSIVVCL